MSVRSFGTPPLIVAICAVPLLSEALSSALEGIADVRSVPARRGGTAGLLRALRPDGVVVDTDEEAAEANDYARESGAPLVHVQLERQRLDVLAAGAWEQSEGDASPETIRNVLVAGIFARRSVTA
jgi:hypothetical protein